MNPKLQGIDTSLFSPAAKFFDEHGVYTHAIDETLEWESFWDEEKRRCMEGYTVDGITITGFHYFYLNYCRMEKVVEKEITRLGKKRKIKDRLQTFPDFWDYDYTYFWVVEIAEHGIEPEDYEELGLEVEIHPDDLSGGKHLIIIKARGKGYSYKAGSMLARNFCIPTDSKNYAMAYDKEYLLRDGVLSKAWEVLDHIDEHTAWAQPKLPDNNMHKSAAFKVIDNGIEYTQGINNHIIGVTLKDDPDKGRGKRGDLIFYEEAGKFPGLHKAFEINRPSVEQGAFVFGIMIVYGTGGTEEGNYESLEILFGNPDGYNCMRIRNQWDDGAQHTFCGFFVPAYKNFEGFMDEYGNSDDEGARNYLQKERDKKKQSKKGASSGLEQFIAEHPFNPREATLNVSTNIFPANLLLEHYNTVITHKSYEAMSYGYLYRNERGEVKFRVNPDSRPLFTYPIKPKDDNEGCIIIKEMPYPDAPDGLYIAGHDPYAHDETTGSSVGATYIFKMTNTFSLNLMDCIVASYVGRPSTQDEYNLNMFMLLEYYNAKLAFENDRGDVIGYARRNKLLHYLSEPFRFMEAKELRGNAPRSYGMNMTAERKKQGEMYIRDWMQKTYANFEDGTKKLILHTIYDYGLLSELMKYNREGNFDRVSALILAAFFMKELEGNSVTNEEKKNPLDELLEIELFQ